MAYTWSQKKSYSENFQRLNLWFCDGHRKGQTHKYLQPLNIKWKVLMNHMVENVMLLLFRLYSTLARCINKNIHSQKYTPITFCLQKADQWVDFLMPNYTFRFQLFLCFFSLMMWKSHKYWGEDKKNLNLLSYSWLELVHVQFRVIV